MGIIRPAQKEAIDALVEQARKDERRKVWREVAALAASHRDTLPQDSDGWKDWDSVVQEGLSRAKAEEQ